MMDHRFMTVAELAQLLRRPTSTIYYWRRTGGGPPGIRLGKHVLFERDAVERWLAAHE
jgi:excisionase family DNA binding protein